MAIIAVMGAVLAGFLAADAPILAVAGGQRAAARHGHRPAPGRRDADDDRHPVQQRGGHRRPLPRRPAVRRGAACRCCSWCRSRATSSFAVCRSSPRRCCRWMVVLLFIHVVSALFSSDQVRAWDATVVLHRRGLRPVLPAHQRHPDPGDAPPGDVGPHRRRRASSASLSIHQDFTNNYDNNYGGFAQAADATFRTGVTTLTGDVVQRRLAGSIGETNRFAQVMLMLVPLGIFRFIGESRLVLRWTAGAATALITLGVVLTFSRGAAVGPRPAGRRAGPAAPGQAAATSPRSSWCWSSSSWPSRSTWLRVSTLFEVGGAITGADGGTGQVDNSLLSRATETARGGAGHRRPPAHRGRAGHVPDLLRGIRQRRRPAREGLSRRARPTTCISASAPSSGYPGSSSSWSSRI